MARGTAWLVPVGLAVVAGATGLLWWNEGRAVRTARALAEGAGIVVETDAASVRSLPEGTLVHLVGPALPDAPLLDPATGLARPDLLRLRRTVETLQWRSSTRGDDHDSRTEYERVWSTTRIDPTASYPDAYRNPTALPLTSATRSADDARLAGLLLADGVLAELSAFVPVALGPADAAALEASLALNGVTIDAAAATAFLPFAAGTADAPRVGDARLRLEGVPAGVVSVVARRSAERLEPYPTRSGVPLAIARAGVHGAQALFDEQVARNRTLTAALRGAGFAAMVGGFRLVLSPLAALVGLIPLVGGLLRFGASAIAAALAVVVASATAGAAWLAFRPLVGVGLLVVAVAGVALLVRRPRGQVVPSRHA